MLLNENELFSYQQALGAASVTSTNILDLGETGTVVGATTPLNRDIGTGCPVEFACKIDAVGGGDGTTALAVQVQVATDEAFTTPKIIGEGYVFEDIEVGARCSVRHIPDFANERYLRLVYTLTGASPDLTLTAGITAGVQTNDKNA